MKSKKILKQAKQNVRAQYVRKKEFNKLLDEVKSLRKAIQRLEGCCEGGEANAQIPAPEKPKAAAKKALADQSSAGQDDLKQINGIGAVLEGKLNALGITRIAQIAAFTQSDIDRVSEHLNFKGRIERDQWIKQAQKLNKASG